MMETRIWPKHSIEMLYKKEMEVHKEMSDYVRCYRCGKVMRRSTCGSWAISRQLDVDVCSSCGIDEALRSVSGRCLPILNWDVTARSEIQDAKALLCDRILLTPVCDFQDVFQGDANVHKICHMRAYYDGEAWIQDWIPGMKYDKSYVADVKEFASSFFLNEDMADEYSMLRLFPVAEQTADPTEVNLYAVQDRFCVWIRLISRSKDYHVYLNFYEKL